MRPHAPEPEIFSNLKILYFQSIRSVSCGDRPFGFSIGGKGCMGYSDFDDADDLTTPTVDDMVTGGDIPNTRAARFDRLQMIDLDRPVETAQ